jgi:hypothetical protein
VATARHAGTIVSAVAVAVFLRAANVGGRNTFSTAALARKLDLVNIGAAGTFVARRRVAAAAIARELSFDTAVIVRPGSEVLALVKAGPPRAPAGVHIFVCILAKPPKRRPSLPIEWPAGRSWAMRAVARRGVFVVCLRRLEVQRGLDLSAILEREFGVPFTTRSWGMMRRVADALSA